MSEKSKATTETAPSAPPPTPRQAGGALPETPANAPPKLAVEIVADLIIAELESHVRFQFDTQRMDARRDIRRIVDEWTPALAEQLPLARRPATGEGG